MKQSYFTVLILMVFGTFLGRAQQDPQFTQYIYNTQVVNPAYAGSAEILSFGLLYRSQYVGLDGAPKTGTFTVNGPIGAYDEMGLGLSIVRDEIGPSTESNITVDYSYSITPWQNASLAFGLKAGVNVLDVDFTKLNVADQGDIFENNIDNKVLPQVGAGIYLNTDKFYAGLSVPNFLTTDHFDDDDISTSQINDITAAERLHYFFIAGYVFDINENLKFKPATLVKFVDSSPLQVDVSANFLINEKLTLGASYRLSAAVSALAGFQISDSLFIGVAYDYETTDIREYSDGSYEAFIRFDLFNNPERILSPRFF